jgi:hypothetical protein
MNETEKRQWLTVDEAYLECTNLSLSRTKKTIRQWCRQEHVECQKRLTSNGEQWMIDAGSLNTKIQSELEFKSSKPPEPQIANTYEPVHTTSEPVRTSSNQSEPVRTGTNQGEPPRTSSDREEIRNLKNQIRSLEIDKGVRDKQIAYLETENEKGRDALSGQSRYIGHLETLALQSGASPNAKFLSSPVPKPKNGIDTPFEKINVSEG